MIEEKFQRFYRDTKRYCNILIRVLLRFFEFRWAIDFFLRLTTNNDDRQIEQESQRDSDYEDSIDHTDSYTETENENSVAEADMGGVYSKKEVTSSYPVEFNDSERHREHQERSREVTDIDDDDNDDDGYTNTEIAIGVVEESDIFDDVDYNKVVESAVVEAGKSETNRQNQQKSESDSVDFIAIDQQILSDPVEFIGVEENSIEEPQQYRDFTENINANIEIVVAEKLGALSQKQVTASDPIDFIVVDQISAQDKQHCIEFTEKFETRPGISKVKAGKIETLSQNQITSSDPVDFIVVEKQSKPQVYSDLTHKNNTQIEINVVKEEKSEPYKRDIIKANNPVVNNNDQEQQLASKIVENHFDSHTETKRSASSVIRQEMGGIYSRKYNKSMDLEDLKMSKYLETHSIPICEGAHAENILYRVKRGSTLHVHPDATLLGRKIILHTNYPEEGQKFVRTEYRVLDWYLKNGKQITSTTDQYARVVDTDIYSEIKLNMSGTYRFWFRYQNSHGTEPDGSLYVQVEPILHVGPPGAQKVIPLDSVRCLTVLSKLLGPINTWDAKLRVAKESGYNVIHFTPIQALGGSKSAYSLRNQLKVNQNFKTSKTTFVDFDDVEKVVMKLRQVYGVASICDIVLNHTANESEWLRLHPDATYSCHTCPYLRPAFLLDAILVQCGEDIADKKLEHVGVPAVIEYECHLEALRHQLHTVYLPKVNIHELYQIDVMKAVNQFMQEVRKREPPKNVAKKSRFAEVKLIPDPEYRRLGATINMELALEIFNAFHGDCFDEESRFRKCAETLRHHLDALNEEVRVEVQGYLSYAVENCMAGVRYERVQGDGPKIRVISEKHPVFMQYFTHVVAFGRSLLEVEEGMYDDMGKGFMAHNGWVMGSSDPLKDFAEEQPGRANVYLKRELIAWGDSVKLRYGQKPEDSPYLWQHMTEYVEITARIFDGVRLDNCHSTPLHVAEYLLDAARKINPELYVVAELFTNSDATDNVFVNRLGITSLIREAQSAWDSHEEGRLVYRYGGAPVGGFYVNPQRDLAPTIAHALFMDLTHDNPSPMEKRSVYDILPTAALVSMACCATGSNRGYDELVPHHIHVVDEKREYKEWGKGVSFDIGIIAAKRALNLLHGQLAEEGFSQVFVDQMDPNIVAVTRHSPVTHQSVILVAHTAFGYPHPNAGPTGVRPLRFEGFLDEIILEGDLCMKSDKPFDRPAPFEKDANVINGYSQFQLDLREHIPLNKSKIFAHSPVIEGTITQLNFENLRPGSVVAVRVSLPAAIRKNSDQLQSITKSLQHEVGSTYNELTEIVSKMNLVDLNRALFMCDQEERDLGHGGGAYDIPGHGPIVYCGLQGFVSILTEISPRNDLGHPLCNNLRLGDWMMDYIANRLSHSEGTKPLSVWLKSAFEPLKSIPRYLIPCYFDAIVSGVYNVLVKHAYTLMPEFIQKGHNFPQSLALASLQFLTVCNSANLPPLSPNIAPPPAPNQCVTLSAGLPHFSTGYMRCWGRDTFIALRGLMLLTGRFNEARYIILGFGQCMRHGLIPNLLDNGSKPRFNCRDAVWWWLHSIKQYAETAPDGMNILKDKVSRIFPQDDSEATPPGQCDQLLYDVMQEAMQIHFQGLQYRERNAGHEIDAHMTDKGFNNQIGVQPETGFVFGGNIANAGTWMDKMGSSEKAGNRGRPATPRDGSAVELVGLQMAVLRFLQHAHEKSHTPHGSVTRTGSKGQKTTWTWKEWAERIKASFEQHFFVTATEKAPLANKKNIYKDSFGASQGWTDYQLRCNFPIAMVVAPELFNPKNAWQALEQARSMLLGPLGMKTLDPDDWNYRGNYDNSNDSDDCTVAHGANYHQGPEWVWPIGYYLRARLIFAGKCGFLQETIAETWSILRAHLKELQTSHWRGLPELTNENGAYCRDSCRTQAWSVAVIMEVLSDLHAVGGDV